MKNRGELDPLTEIVAVYGDFVSHNSERLPCGIPESELPYSKETIQDAIERVYLAYDPLYKKQKKPELKQYLDLLELGYEYLGLFLPESEIEFKDKPNEEQTEPYLLYIAKLLQRQESYRKKLREIKERLE